MKSIAPGTVGSLDLTNPQELRFETPPAPAGFPTAGSEVFVFQSPVRVVIR